MTHGRALAFALILASAGVALAACGGGRTTPAVVAPVIASTSIPVPTATSATVAVGSGATAATVVVPPITGAAQGSTVTVTATNARPSALPSAAPMSAVYVSVTLPSGATSSKAATLVAPSGSVQWAYGTVTMSNTVAAPAARKPSRRPSSQTVTVLYDPENVNGSGLQMTFSSTQWQAIESSTSLSWFSPDLIDQYDGQQQDVNIYVTGSGPANPANWLAFLDGQSSGALAPLLHVSTSTCSPNAPTCFHLKLATTSPGPFANGIKYFFIGFYNEPYLGLLRVYSAANPNPTPTPAVIQTANFTFNTSMNDMVSGAGGTVPTNGSGFSSANISFPGTTQSVGPATLTATTSVSPIVSSVSSALQTGHTFINAIDFTFPAAMTFGSAPGFTADFCFPSSAVLPMTLWRYYGTSAPLSMGSGQPVSDPVNCPNALYPYHLAEPTQLDGATINANDHFGYVLTTP